MLKVAEDDKKAVAVEVNAETDFVAKNEKFQAYVAQVAEQALETDAADIDAFLAETWKCDTTKTVNRSSGWTGCSNRREHEDSSFPESRQKRTVL